MEKSKKKQELLLKLATEKLPDRDAERIREALKEALEKRRPSRPADPFEPDIC